MTKSDHFPDPWDNSNPNPEETPSGWHPDDMVPVPDESREPVPCRNCDQGHAILGEQFITHDMAIDAENPDLEGMSMGPEWGRCECCQGDDWQDCPNCRAAAEAESEQPRSET